MAERRGLRMDTRGLSTVEYIILAALIGVVTFTSWKTFGETVADKVGLSDDSLSALGPSDILSGGGDHMFGASDVGLSGGGGRFGGVASPGADGSGGVWGEGGLLGRGSSEGIGAIARGVTDGAIDLVGGAIEGVGAIASGLWDAATNPAAVAEAVTDAVMNPAETGRAAWAAATDAADRVVSAGKDLVEACASGDAYACSRGVTNVAGSVIPIGTAGTVARGAGAVRAGTSGANRVGAAVRRRNDGEDRAVAGAADGSDGTPLARDPDTGRWDPERSNRASHEAYKRDLRANQRRNDLMESVEDDGLRDIIGGRNGLYRENARVGSGSTADAVRHERRTGERVGNASHTQKAEEGVTRLDDWMESNPNARMADRQVAEQVRADLADSLYGPLD